MEERRLYSTVSHARLEDVFLVEADAESQKLAVPIARARTHARTATRTRTATDMCSRTAARKHAYPHARERTQHARTLAERVYGWIHSADCGLPCGCAQVASVLSKHCDDLKKIYRFYARGTGGHSATLMSASEYLKFCTDVQANANAAQRATLLQLAAVTFHNAAGADQERLEGEGAADDRQRAADNAPQTTRSRQRAADNAQQTTRSVRHATHTVQRAAHTRNTVLRFTCCTSHPPMRASPSSRRATRARM